MIAFAADEHAVEVVVTMPKGPVLSAIIPEEYPQSLYFSSRLSSVLDSASNADLKYFSVLSMPPTVVPLTNAASARSVSASDAEDTASLAAVIPSNTVRRPFSGYPTPSIRAISSFGKATSPAGNSLCPVERWRMTSMPLSPDSRDCSVAPVPVPNADMIPVPVTNIFISCGFC